jgi:hypothetical protein
MQSRKVISFSQKIVRKAEVAEDSYIHILRFTLRLMGLVIYNRLFINVMRFFILVKMQLTFSAEFTFVRICHEQNYSLDLNLRVEQQSTWL